VSFILEESGQFKQLLIHSRHIHSGKLCAPHGLMSREKQTVLTDPNSSFIGLGIHSWARHWSTSNSDCPVPREQEARPSRLHDQGPGAGRGNSNRSAALETWNAVQWKACDCSKVPFPFRSFRLLRMAEAQLHLRLTGSKKMTFVPQERHFRFLISSRSLAVASMPTVTLLLISRIFVQE
jgi:hypothetical protein